MNLKRTLALLAALAALVSLGGCAVNGPYDALSSLSGPAAAPEVTVSDTAPDVFAEPTEAPVPTAKPTPEPTEKPEPTAKPTPKPSPRPAHWGTVNGDTYVNKHFGVTCTLADGWTFLSDGELSERVTGAVEDPVLNGFEEDMHSFLEADGNACVAAGVSEDGLRSFNIVVEYLSGWDEYISEEDLCTIALHQLGVEDGGDLADLGLPGGTIAQNTFSFAGEKHPGLYLTFTDSSLGIDMPVHMQFLYLIRDGYAMQITMSSDFDEAGLAEAAEMFTVDE